jgi:subtilisin family serine protease
MNRKIHTSLLTMCLLMILITYPIRLYAGNERGEYQSEELVCEMETGYSIDIIINDYGTSIKGFQQQINCYLLGMQQGQDAESLAVIIDARSEVKYCGANYYFDAPEPFQRSSPFLDNNFTGDFDLQPAAVELDLETVSTIATGTDVKVAVIDCGINLTHPEFAIKSGGIFSGWDYIDNDSIANDEPGGVGSGHGTFVAGVVRLVAPGAQIYAYRVLDTLGRGDGYTVADAILRAIDDSCRVINLSLGMIGRHEAVDEALKYAEQNDIIVVAAAGNDSTHLDPLFPFPAMKSSCLTVAALDSVNQKADFSNFGTKVDICAPGTQIYAPHLDTLYAWWDGTSFAAPFVSGLAALIISINPAITREQLDNVVAQTAINIDSLNPGMEDLLGNGLIDIMAALETAADMVCGDANATGAVDVSDAVYIINYIFCGGPPPFTERAGDPNCSYNTDISDAVYLINYVFNGGPPPCAACR